MENSTLNVGDSDDLIDVIVEATSEDNGEAIGLNNTLSPVVVEMTQFI